jgi:hypothetical protein
VDGNTFAPLKGPFAFPLSLRPVWDQTPAVGGTPGQFAVIFSTGTSFYLQPVFTNGTKFGAPRLIYNTPFPVEIWGEDSSTLPTAVKLSNGVDIVIVWSNTSGIHGIVFDAISWTAKSSFFEITPVQSGFQVNALQTPGCFAVTWLRDSGLRTRVGQVNNTSTNVTLYQSFLVSGGVAEFSSEALQTTNGTYVVGWTSGGNTTGYYGRIFNSTGRPQAGRFIIRTLLPEQGPLFLGGPTLWSALPLVISLPDGGFVALSATKVSGSGGIDSRVSHLYSRAYSSTGSPLTPSEVAILAHIKRYTAVGLNSGGWVVAAEYNIGEYPQESGIVLKSFSSSSDINGLESYPVSATGKLAYKNSLNIFPSRLLELISTNQSSNIAFFWRTSHFYPTLEKTSVFGLRCTLLPTQCALPRPLRYERNYSSYSLLTFIPLLLTYTPSSLCAV